MPDKRILILNHKQIAQKIDRMAFQILEDSLEEREIVIAGIADRGYTLAQRIKAKLGEISGFKITLMKIELDKDSTHLQAATDISLEAAANKTVILVDDVLNSGRTLVYGLGVFLNIPLKKLRTLVLVDRSHHSFPISTDFTGFQLATVLKEHVDVILSPDGEDAVYLS
ncbi:MAG TPA: phosphoribosyltransferase family protein [Sphingobacteriaceae bacterium]